MVRATVPAVRSILSGGAAVEDTRSDAARRADTIRSLTIGIADDLERLRKLVHEAKAAEDHIALGYASWTAYLADLFGAEPLRLAREVRRELVAELAAQGMSTRAIAPIVGATKSQVARDVAADPGRWPDPAPMFDAPEAAPDGTPAVVVIEEATKIRGLDGKNYARPAPRAPEEPPARPVVVTSLRDRVLDTVGYIDVTVTANAGNGPDVVWSTPEVLELLADIRHRLMVGPQ